MTLPDPHIDPEKLSGRRVRTEAVLGAICALLVVLLGPRVRLEETFSAVDVPEDVDGWLASHEARVPDLRPGDGKTVVWADSVGTRTPLSLVYLHGFSADRHEMAPVAEMLADSLGANLFYTRFTGHGRDGAAMAEATGEAWLQDMAEAMAVGRKLGDRVILIGSSTGATLATWTAGRPEFRDDIAALVFISPNFHPRDRRARLLLWPWGQMLAELFTGEERCWEPFNEEQGRHWTTCYPTRAVLPMMAVVERVRTMDLDEVTAPALVLYSADDSVVDADATTARVARMGSVPKRLVPFQSAGDPSQHILAGDIMSGETNGAVVREILSFIDFAEIRP